MNARQTLLRRAGRHQAGAFACVLLGAVGFLFAWPAGAALWALAFWMHRDALVLRSLASEK